VDVGYTAGDPHLSQRVANAAVEVLAKWTREELEEKNSRQASVLARQIEANDAVLRSLQDSLVDFRMRNQVFSATAEAQGRQQSIL
jgi:uncharacterized protein involved in exopolysaccharide biosynthesis